MTTNTNSAQERTASIDLDKLTRYDANIPMGRMQACSDGDYFKVDDVRALARRASATPSSKDAGGEPMYQISIDCTNVLWKDVDKEDYDEHPSDWKREKRIVYAAPVHAAAAPCDYCKDIRDAEAIYGDGPSAEQAPAVLCPRCQGSGEGKMMVGGGPDAYEIDSNCEECGGIGEVPASAAGANTEPSPGSIPEFPDNSSSAAGAGSEQQGEREMFEEWATRNLRHWTARASNGSYYAAPMDTAWGIWQARAALDQGAQADTTASASVIKTWQERSGMREFIMPKDAVPHMVAEIRDLRAALARAPLPEQADGQGGAA